MKKHKQTQRMKHPYLGFVRASDQAICINLQLLWEQEGNENKFIEEFAKTHSHELLHIVLARTFDINTVSLLAEERVVRTMLDEEWDDEIENMYTI